MRNLKKVLTLVLALVMVIGCLAIGAGAAYTDDAAITYDDAVSTLTSLGVFEGADGAFNPKANLTRQEVAKIVTVLLTGGNFDPALYEDAKIFTDVDGLWGEGYINYLAGAGIASGHAGKYNPQAPVTAQELAKFMLVALGYPAELFTGDTWADNINRLATTTKDNTTVKSLYKDYVGTFNKALTREEAALIMYNALTSNVVQAAWGGSINNNGSWNWTWNPIADTSNTLTLVEKYFNCTGTPGTVVATAADYVELTGNEVVVNYETTKYAVSNYDGKLADSVTVYVHNKTAEVVAVGSVTPAPAAKTVTLTTTTAMDQVAAKAALLAAGWTDTAAEAAKDHVEAKAAQGVKVVFTQKADGSDADEAKTVITKAAMPYYVTESATAYTVTAISTDTDWADCADASYTVYKDAAQNVKLNGEQYTGTLVKGAYYTVTDLAETSSISTAVRIKYATATPVVTFAPMATVAGVTGESFTAKTVTLSGNVYALSYLNSLLSDPEPGYGAKTTQNVYLAGLSKSENGTLVGANLVVDAYGNIVAATAAGKAATSNDLIHIFAANVTLNGVGTVFSDYSAKIEAITDDGAYGIYDLALTYKAGTGFYSGNLLISDSTPTADEIQTALDNDWWSYTIADGVVTLIAKQTSTKVSDQDTSTGGNQNWTVTPGTVAPSVIKIATADKIVTDSTEFVYFNDPGDNHLTTVVSVQKAGAISIAYNSDVYVLYTDTTNAVVAKIIVIGATYGSGTSAKYVYVDKATESATAYNAVPNYIYTYATIDAAGAAGTATVKDSAVADTGVYALKEDGTISSTAATGGYLVSITGNVVAISSDDNTSAEYYLAMAEGIAPVLVKATYKAVPTAPISYTTNTAGYISGLWVVGE